MIDARMTIPVALIGMAVGSVVTTIIGTLYWWDKGDQATDERQNHDDV